MRSLLLTIGTIILLSNSVISGPILFFNGTKVVDGKTIIYRGIENTIRVRKSKKYLYQPSGSNVMIKVANSKNSKFKNYIIKPGKGKKATLSLTKKWKDGRSLVLKKWTLHVSNHPDPIVHLSKRRNGEICKKSAKIVTAELPKKIHSPLTFTIKNINLTIGDQSLYNKGGKLNKEMKTVLKHSESGSEIIIRCTVVGTDGISRQIVGKFRLK